MTTLGILAGNEPSPSQWGVWIVPPCSTFIRQTDGNVIFIVDALKTELQPLFVLYDYTSYGRMSNKVALEDIAWADLGDLQVRLAGGLRPT